MSDVLLVLIILVAVVSWYYFRKIEKDFEEVFSFNKKILEQVIESLENSQDILEDTKRLDHLENVVRCSSDLLKELLEMNRAHDEVITNIIKDIKQLYQIFEELETKVEREVYKTNTIQDNKEK